MLESSVMEFAKWFIGIISAGFVIATAIFLFQLNQVNSFQQEVNYQIERHGGLTQDALVALDKHARENYGGCLEADAESKKACKFGGTESSGFFVREYKTTGGKNVWVDRGVEQSSYGSEVKYVLIRKIGIGQFSNIKELQPVVAGLSVSRVRGTITDDGGAGNED